MGAWILRAILFFICGVSGYYLAVGLSSSPGVGLFGIMGGLLVATLTLLLEVRLRKIPLKSLIGCFIGLFVGIMVASLVSNLLFSNWLNHQTMVLPLYAALYGICGYIGIRIGYKKGEEFHFPGWKPFSKSFPHGESTKVLDTSVIIDGRIADITETGFIEGPLLIPRFVLSELQHIADSPDSVKRTRGKRGLEVLHHMQKQVNLDVRIVDRDFPLVREVDAKLIELAKEVRGKIITNDSNLNKVAELQGIKVLNINELANALKPVVLPGEDMTVKILKEGKEIGLAYLDDGTMIVIDNGKKHIGRVVDVTVTSVLQTPAGRMIFARLKEENGRESRGRDYYSLDSEL